MKALVIESPRHAVIREVAYPKPGFGEVTLKVERTGICGTDIHIYEGTYMASYPIIPGHEYSGIVHEIGEGVSGYEIGDRVSSDPNIFCGHCEFCQTHRSNQCLNFAATGVTRDGSMAEFVRVPAKTLSKIPDDMTFQQAAFIEPVSCVVYALHRLQMKAGDRAILFGAGAMGQLLVQALAHAGASKLVVVDVEQSKLDTAKQYGATQTVLSQHLSTELNPVQLHNQFDVVIDATGIPAVIEQALSYMGRTAKYLQFGVADSNVTVPLNPYHLFNNDWTILGSMAVHYTFIPALRWMQENRIRIDHLVSDVISLEQAVEFFQMPKNKNHLKIQIQL